MQRLRPLPGEPRQAGVRPVSSAEVGCTRLRVRERAALACPEVRLGEGWHLEGRSVTRSHPYSIAKQPCFVAPRFGRAWGLPVSFPIPPKSEGVWRARADARGRNAPVQRATGFSRFRVPRCPDQGQPLVAGGVAPGSARG